MFFPCRCPSSSLQRLLLLRAHVPLVTLLKFVLLPSEDICIRLSRTSDASVGTGPPSQEMPPLLLCMSTFVFGANRFSLHPRSWPNKSNLSAVWPRGCASGRLTRQRHGSFSDALTSAKAGCYGQAQIPAGESAAIAAVDGPAQTAAFGYKKAVPQKYRQNLRSL